MEKIKFLNYIIHDLPNGDMVLQNQVGTTLIKDTKLINFMKELESQNKLIIEVPQLLEVFQDDEILLFLHDNKIVTHYIEPEFSFESIILIIEDSEICELLNNLLKELTDIPIEVVSSKNYKEIKRNKVNSLFICFIKEYRKEKVVNLLESIHYDNSNFSLLSYCYRNAVYFDCLYSNTINTPCHNCNTGITDGQLYEVDGGITYQELIKMIFQIDNNYATTSPLTFRNKMLIANQICQQLEGILPESNDTIVYKHYQDIVNVYKLDLLENNIISDTAIFWEMCDCYEKI